MSTNFVPGYILKDNDVYRVRDKAGWISITKENFPETFDMVKQTSSHQAGIYQTVALKVAEYIHKENVSERGSFSVKMVEELNKVRKNL